MAYDTAALRELLLAAFNDEDFTIFCYDHFRPVHDEKFSTGMNHAAKVQALIAYCEEQAQIDTLLALVKQKNSNQYEKFGSRLKTAAQTAKKSQSEKPFTNAAGQPSLFINVPPMPDHFVGRDELMARMVERLVGGETLALSAEGLPGVGKTTLAVALAHHPKVRRHFREGILWAGLGKQADVMSALASWAEALKMDVSDRLTEQERAQAIRNAIGQGRYLLVIDDAWDIEAARHLRCGGPNCCHLLTTRNQTLARQFADAAQAVAVPVLEPDPAFGLLQTLAPEACAADPDAARALAQSVGGLPLVLELLGGYLAAPENSLFADLSTESLAELSDPEKRLQLAQVRLGSHEHAEVTLAKTIELSLADLPTPALDAFLALGAFAPKPEQFGRAAAEAVAQTNARTLALLAARNLLEVEEGTERLALHQTLAEFSRHHTKADPEATTRHRDYYLAQANEDPEDWQRIEAIYGQLKWAWANALEDESELDLIWALRIYQGRRGLWRDYLNWAKQGLTLAEKNEWREVAGTLLNNIGWVYNQLGQRHEALDYHERALPIREEVGDRAGVATTLNNIGEVYRQLESNEKALSYFERTLPILEEIDNRAGLAATLNNIGLVYDNLGQREDALHYV